MLFIIYFDSMMRGYSYNLQGKIKYRQQTLLRRTHEQEYSWVNYICEKIRTRKTKRPYNDQDIRKTTEQQSDKHLNADDVTVKINNIDEIYSKIITCGRTGK